MVVLSNYYKWLVDHRNLVMRYLYYKFPLYDHTLVLLKFREEPKNAYYVVSDFYRENHEKIDDILRCMEQTSYFIGLIAGDPGSGKDSWLWYLMKRYYQKHPDLKAYMYEEVDIPYWASNGGKCFDLNDASDDSWVIFRELAKTFPARDFKAESNKQLGLNLLDNRHHNQKFFGNAIKLALVDVNYIRASNYKFFKYINKDSLMFEREQILTPLLRMMLPKHPEDKSEVLCVIDGKYMSVRYDIDEDFTDDYSKSRGKITFEEYKNIAIGKLLSNFKPQEVQAYMYLKFRFKQPISFYNSLI